MARGNASPVRTGRRAAAGFLALAALLVTLAYAPLVRAGGGAGPGSVHSRLFERDRAPDLYPGKAEPEAGPMRLARVVGAMAASPVENAPPRRCSARVERPAAAVMVRQTRRPARAPPRS
jgi:hypothetical protein